MTMQKIISPIDGSVFAERELATDTQVDRVLANAITAGRQWRATPIAERIRVVEAMAQVIVIGQTNIKSGLIRVLTAAIREDDTVGNDGRFGAIHVA